MSLSSLFTLYIWKSMVKPKVPQDDEASYIKKKGFKCDRIQRYRDKKMGKKTTQSNRSSERPKEVKFNSRDRETFLATFVKTKEKRRLKATAQKKLATKRKQKIQKQDTRETARQQYNMSMHLPINPDFTITLPSLRPQQPSSSVSSNTMLDEKNRKTVVYSNSTVVTSTPFELPRN
ncbi:hypothetical protein XU18_0363 [Perkinsela sp. CCAP 1560/4]|nr:hypothetical protein XU18_0363 [Perkinsela sp. CCAP 1560/4]|eukprot:KNH09678.1 hypothetical protein XU18_0363 [Perkinsela sp. CCAP 1560/4]